MVARIVPMRLGYSLAQIVGDAFYLLLARQRRIVSENLNYVMGESSNEEQSQQKTRGVFRSMTKSYFELIKLPYLNFETMGQDVTVHGYQHLETAVNNGKGTIIATAHLGTFEMCAHILAARGIKMTIFVEEFDSSPFLSHVAELRGGNGVKIVPIGPGTLRESLRLLRDGGTVTIVCDRDIQGTGTKARFFGEETLLPVGAINLALRTGATIIPVFSVRQASHQSEVFIEPPLDMIDIGKHSRSVKENLEKLVAVMEKYIRQYPEQWIVMEPVWNNKTQAQAPIPAKRGCDD